MRSIRHYRRYSKKKYNFYTYKVEIDNTKDSNKSKELISLLGFLISILYII